jgi:hypothetical protein
MKYIGKHIVDAGLAFGISFLSAVLALDAFTWKAVIIAGCASMLICLIKFRDFWNTQLSPKKPVPTIFL